MYKLGFKRARARLRECAREESARARAQAVAEALETFAGSASDEKLWANFAWRRGLGEFLDAVDQAMAEMREHTRPVADSEKPKILQSVLSVRWRKGGRA